MFYNAKNEKIEIEDTVVPYISFGKGKENLIIIPGVGEGFKMVKGVAIPFAILYRMFAKDYKVYVFSRREKMPENFSNEDMANDIIEHMKELNIEKAHVFGVSQGGMIAQCLAIKAPEKVDKLVLCVTVARQNEILEETINSWEKMAEEKDYKAIMMDTAEKSYTGEYLEKNRKWFELLGRLSKKKDFTRFLIQAKACLNHNTYDDLDKIKSKTLIIGAAQDKALGIEGTRELAEKIKNSELYIYEEYSHGVYEQAKDFNSRVLEFLKK